MIALQPRYGGKGAPDWLFVLSLAKLWNCPPWEIDPSDPPGLWAIRELRVTAIRERLQEQGLLDG